jgi:hypothetical protein
MFWWLISCDYLDRMQNDGHTINDIEYNNYIMGTANLLTKYGFATVRTTNILSFINDLETRFNLKAIVDENKAFLKRGEYFLRIQ